MAVKRLGTLLVEEQMITEEQLQSALAEQKKNGEPLGEVLVRLGVLSEESLFRFLAIQNGLEYESIEAVEISPALAKLVSVATARKYHAVPIAQAEGSVTIATSQPDDLSLFYLPKEIRLPAETRLRIVVSPQSQVMALLEKHFPLPRVGEMQTVKQAADAAPKAEEPTNFDDVTDELINPEDINLEQIEETKVDDEDPDTKLDSGPLIKLCDFIIIDAVRKRASDIHINPYEKKIVLKYRIDGSLIEFASPPVAYRRRLATRFKLMANLNIIQKRMPQDGRIHIIVDGRPVDLRIATLPTRWGENIVMRVVDQSNSVLELDKLGMEATQLEHFKKAITQPYGMVFVTGPTASGKTTTLFASLNHINSPNRNILTVEDPVEFRLPHIIQIQVDHGAGRTFASVLRAFLRHDPNIVLVGEIRDPETADIAIKASLTGHLVLSSVHTNDAPSTIMRLVDLGIDPAYVGSSVLMVAAQRLIRHVCEKCKEEVHPSEAELKRVGVTPEQLVGKKLYRGKGCAECHNMGYKGRLAVYEVMPVNAAIRDVIFRKGTLAELKAESKSQGFLTIRQAAILKWLDGQTSLEEVLGETFE
jgi:type IV pilus assembly protein PilB